jgi:CelD/BcsL family acetyltransferase involved in cellulose biosynthesis
MIRSRHIATADWPSIGTRWQALETHADVSFFQSWTWIGCLAAERFRDAVVVEATYRESGPAIAVFDRRSYGLRTELVLNDSGDSRFNNPYVEHNGVLGPPSAEIFRHMLSGWRPRRIRLNGVSDATLQAAREAAAVVVISQTEPAPFVDLTRNFIESRSRNTRYQIRRSDRAYGVVHVESADCQAAAHSFLEQMAVLHETSWKQRGKQGVFSDPFFCRFHHALIERGWPRGEIELLRVTGNGILIGYLYNFKYRDTVMAYQSGIDYSDLSGGRHPGLTCHHAAIQNASLNGFKRYDFLAGDARYKRSLADSLVTMHWALAGWDMGLVTRHLAERLRLRSGIPA